MGNIKSRRSRKDKNKKVKGDYDRNQSSDIDDYDEDEDNEMKWLRRTIRNDPQYFVLNNLMMCVQFFENYEKDIARIRKGLVSSREPDINEQLAPHKHVLLPDVLQEEVARNVGFTSSRQTLRPTVEPLQPVRIYVVHDNIEVIEEDDPTYSPMNDTSIYSMVLKRTEHRGYVKLQLQEDTPLLKKVIAEEESNAMKNDDGFYSDGDSMYGPKYARNTGVVLDRQSKNSRSSKYSHNNSLPNLYDEDTMYEKRERLSQENIYGSGCSHNRTKVDSDNYKVDSLIEERSYRVPEPPPRNGYSNRGGHHSRTRPYNKTKLYSNFSRASSISSGYKSGNYVVDSDSDCSCNHTCNLSRSCDDLYSSADASKNMEAVYFQEDSDISQIPRKCFKKITYTSEGKIYDPLEERKYPMNNKQKRIRQVLRRYNYNVFYVSSLYFMRHFFGVFVHQLIDVFGFDHEAVEDMKPEGCIIYYDKVIISHAAKLTMVEPYEIIPSIWSQWPDDAKEWLIRPRSTWPNDDDLGKIRDLGCYIVPEGFSPKKGINTYQNIEWLLTFPAAERYLETCMTSAQIHVYLMALMLHKTFIRPVFDSMFGLTTAHIRNRLFWMIEENDRPSKWPNNRTGECLVKFLESMYFFISQNDPTLSDYFIRDRNLFQKIPSEHLLHTQKQIKRILENPIMYVFHAMENVKYTHQFFPKINFEVLLNILTANALTLINPALAGYVHKPMSKSNEDEYNTSKSSKHIYTDTRPGGFWVNARNVSRNEDEQKIYANRPTVTNKTLINPRKATDSVIEISVRCGDLDGIRLCALLDFFISHFIKMGERFHQYRAIQQKMMYLDQADRLSILLSEYPRYKEDAKAYRDKIKTLRKRQDYKPGENVPQQKPMKNIEEPIFTMPLKNRFNKESLDILSPIANETMQSDNKDHTYDSASVTKAMIEERPRTPPSARINRAVTPTPPIPVPTEQISSPTRRVPNPIDKISNPTKRVASPTDKVSSPTSRVPSPVNKIASPTREVSSSTKKAQNDRESLNSSMTLRDKKETSTPRVVSLVENENDSFLSETTYI
ncbi:Protein MB21D2 [Vespula maculifrons]|uniref:Protein MB21D2 n=1 Tax=Vespula maculifrons TaxID=7453 RepID=A0ABD2AS98_VESMC